MVHNLFGHFLLAAASTWALVSSVTVIPHCSLDEALTQRDAFWREREVSKHSSGNSWQRCPSYEWLEILQELSPKGPKVFVDVGCGQGMFSSRLLAMWAPELALQPADVSNIAMEHASPGHDQLPGAPCGPCDECKDNVDSSILQSKGKINVYCLEPAWKMHEQVVLARDRLMPSNESDVQWHVLRMALLNQTVTAMTPPDCTSTFCFDLTPITPTTTLGPNATWINILTLDEFMRQGLPVIDLLRIDTGGNNPLVLLGAVGSIQDTLIGIITFEYSHSGSWVDIRLRTVLGILEGGGYVCYFDGEVLTRLTRCWHDDYEKMDQAWVLCVHQSHKVLRKFDILSHGSGPVSRRRKRVHRSMAQRTAEGMS